MLTELCVCASVAFLPHRRTWQHLIDILVLLVARVQAGDGVRQRRARRHLFNVIVGLLVFLLLLFIVDGDDAGAEICT